MELQDLPFENLTAADVWSRVDLDTRGLAARALYESEDRHDDAADADAAIAGAIRFRLVAVRRMPIDKRIGYLARSVRPDESLAAKLLRALHLAGRSTMLGAFLDALEIPHEAGVIDDSFDFDANVPGAERLSAALITLDSSFPQEHVDLYAATLLAMDPDCWGPLAEVLPRRIARD